MTIRVVLVDDQAMVRTGLRMVLAAEPDIDVVGEAADVERFVADVTHGAGASDLGTAAAPRPLPRREDRETVR